MTACRQVKGVETALNAGADDYVTKPFFPKELAAGVNVGKRVIELQARLAEKIERLEGSVARIRRLEGLLPICSWCKSIRNDQVLLQEHPQRSRLLAAT
jgi:sigma-B regulation protein RsbU (phosphoserine phosphatase)